MKEDVVRSPLFYVGDKYKLMREIRKFFPSDIGRLIEPFVGGGSVFMNTPTSVCLANDIDANVIDIHRMLCEYKNYEQDFFNRIFEIVNSYGLSLSLLRDDVPNKLKEAYPKTYYAKFNKEPYKRLRHDYNAEGKTDVFKLYVLLIYGFNRMLRFNSAGDFNLPVGNVDFNLNTSNAIKEYFKIAKEKDIRFCSLDFRNFLKNLEFRSKDLVYLDPPYLITFSEYNKLWNEETEQALLQVLDDLNNQRVNWAISNVTHYKGKTNELFLNWAQNYNVHPIKSNYISFHDNTNKIFNEVLITNY